MCLKNNMKELSGWGRYPKILTKELMPESETQLLNILRNNKSYIARGNGRSYEGSFGNYIKWIDIVNDKNEIIRCSKSQNTDLFGITIGGMGLTGIIVRCSIQLRKVKSGWIKQRTVVNNNLKESLQSFHNHKNTTYSVAWIDCLATGKSFGRSILMLGEHANMIEVLEKNSIFPKRKKQKASFFFNIPSFLLNNSTVSLFNKIYFNFYKNKRPSYRHWDSFFYPLDAIKHWNRMYGQKGFFQFQCLLSNESSDEGFKKILEVIQKKSSGSFLAVLKQFGAGNENLSFPKKGFTLALDFKATEKNIKVGNEIIDIVNNFKGSIYLAKDALMDSHHFKQQISKDLIEKFSQHRNKFIKSEQSIRIDL